MVDCLTITDGKADVSQVPESEFPEQTIILLDNDETCGYFPRASIVYNCLKFLYPEKDTEKYIPFFIKEFFDKGGARPGLKEFLQHLNRFKDKFTIHKLGIFTSASDHNGWVSFLARCYEVYADIKIDIVYDRNKVGIVGSNRIIKDLRHFNYDLTQVIIVDDKPMNVYGKVIGVPEYKYNVDLDFLIKSLPISEENSDFIHQHLEHDKQKFPYKSIKSESESLRDNYLEKATKVLDDYFSQEIDSTKLSKRYQELDTTMEKSSKRKKT